jgi:hypothetical protein
MLKEYNFPSVIITIIIFLSVCLSGCAGFSPTGENTEEKTDAMPVMCAEYTSTPINIDGKLDEPVWKNTQVYELHLADNQAKNGKEVTETGEVRLAWDNDYFYVGVIFYDSDIAAEGEEDQLKHYKLGDLCELFLTPENETWYWELYATPAGRKSSYFIPGRGSLGLPGIEKYKCGLKVAAKCNGTINDWRDKDVSWTAEMAMPVKDLTARGESFGPDSHWRILVSRYNFSRYLETKGAELSMTPKLSAENYHLLPEYAILKFNK